MRYCATSVRTTVTFGGQNLYSKKNCSKFVTQIFNVLLNVKRILSLFLLVLLFLPSASFSARLVARDKRRSRPKFAIITQYLLHQQVVFLIFGD